MTPSTHEQPTHGADGVVLVISMYPPDVGGAETHVARIADRLLRRGHAAQVLTVNWHGREHVRRWRDPCDVPITSFGARRWPLRRMQSFALDVVRTLVRERARYGVAQFHMVDTHTVAGVLAARCLGRGAVVMLACGGAHGEVAQARESLAARWRLWAALRWAHRVVVLNPEMEADVLRLGVSPTKVVRSSCGVDAETFAPVDADTRARLRQSFGLHPEHVVTAYCGRLAVQKELPTLVDAHARTGDRDAMLVLAGDGPLRDALRAQVAQRGVTDSVRFLGPLSRERVGALLQASDVFTLVSAAEGSPCALIEAMATALPCVVSDIAGNRDLVDDGVHGLRVAVRDVEGLAAALTRLRRDATARQNMGANARARVLAQHTLDAVVARYEAVYRELRGGA